MMHDKLLAKIDDNWTGELANSDLAIALRAVVELHKPFMWNSNNPQLSCTACNKITDDGDIMPAPYPCPTIQAIEKGLA